MNTKQKRALIAIITLLIIFAIGCVEKIFATDDVHDLADIAKLTEEEKEAKERDDNPETTYLVTDNCISRILPNTSTQDFVSNFKNEKIKLYKDKTCQEEISSGYVCSGMYAKYETNERVFEISVLGDINQKEEQGKASNSGEMEENTTPKILKGDSNLNEIECTRVIKALFGTEKWKIEDEAEIKSADVSCSKKIDEQDIDSIVHYIVFGEIEAPKVEKIETPSLKVVKGLKNEDGSFEGKATVELTQNAKNGTKNIYRILKSKEEYLEVSNEEEIEFTQPGTYTIIAYTYGELGNKSKGELKTVVVKPAIYKLTLIAGENVVSVNGTNEYKVGDTVKIDATIKNNEPGYTYTWGAWISDNPELVENKAMKNAEITMPKGNVTLTAHAVKNTVDFSIKYNLNGGELPEGVTNPETYTIETTTITLNNPSKPGYKFIGWTEKDGDKPETTLTIEMGNTGDKEYTANYEKLPNVEYIVKHYKEDLTGSNYELAEIERYSDYVGKTINVKEEGYIKEYTGFSFDKENSDNYLVGKVVESETDEGKLIFKIYYKRNLYNLILTKNENIEKVTTIGNSEEKEDGTIVGKYKYQQPVEIDATIKEQPGYRVEFDMWKSGNTKLLTNRTDKRSEFTMPARDVGLEAIAIKYAREDTPYTIEYYYQENGTYPSEPKYTVEGIGTTGTTKSILEIEKQPTIAGYKFDDKNVNNVLQGKIEGDGSLVLKVYFKQQFKVSYLPGTHGKFTPQITNLDYGAATPQFEGELTHEEGYEFAGWNKEIAETVTENIEYTATWEEKIYKIEYNLNGGQLPEGKTNPTTYTIEDEAITLNNPVKNGYRFIGWTGTDIEEVTDNVKIETGSTGDRTYIANWEAIEYTITYELNEGTLLEGKTNPEKYTAETESFTLNNPVKIGYTFLGWTGTDIEEVTDNVTISSGSTGNREYIANWERNTGVKYTVEYYGENLEGTSYDLLYTNEKNDRTTEDHVNLEIKDFAGFTFDSSNENNKLEGDVAGDGSLVLKAYYTRNSYNLTLYAQKENNIQKLILNKTEENITDNENIRISKTLKFEAPIEINAEIKETLGYTTIFEKWESSNTELMADQGNKKVNFTMPAGDLTIEAKATKTANLSDYTVAYYYEGEKGYLDTPTSSTTRQNLTGETAVIENSDKVSQKDGYQYDETAENKLTGEVVGDGSLVLKIYFKRSTYNVTLIAGENIQEVIGQGTYKYGEKVTIDAVLKNEEGYVISFAEWVGSYDTLLDNKENIQTNFTMPYDNVTLTATANKQAREDIGYTVEYYYQENGEYSSTANDRDVRTDGTTGQEVTVKEEDKISTREGYIFDDTKTENLSGEVTGDGSLVLKVYFKQQLKVSYLPGTHGKFTTQITNLDYGAATTQFEGELTHEEGYEFAGWNKEIAETVTENIEYTATWEEKIYKIEYNLNGGQLLEGTTNPSTYTVEDEDITLNNPVKNGYRFIGWTGTDLEEATPELTIETGNTGDRTYIANWEAIEYTITYELNNGELLEGKTNPEKYTIETESFTLNIPVKTGYTFLGWTGTELEEATDNVTISSGSTGNREYIANWERNTGTRYTVEYYVENIEGTEYELKERNELSGTTEDHVNIEIKEFVGFTFDTENENNKLEGYIEGDENLVLKAYYTRNSYNLTLYAQKENNIQKLILNKTEENINDNENIRISQTFKFEEPIEINSEIKETLGYITIFEKWESSTPELMADQGNKKVNFTMPAGDLTLEAKATKTENISNYTVEYYYEGENGYPESPETTDKTRAGLIGTTVNIEESDKISKKVGYEYDETAENKLTGTVEEEGNLVLKVYFKKSEYNLTIIAGDEITQIKLDELTAGKEETLSKTYKYGENVTIDATYGEEIGYTIEFVKWKSNNTNLMEDNTGKQLEFTMPAGNLRLTAMANKTPLETTYKVEYYYQENGVYPSTPKESDTTTRTGTTGQEVSLTEADKETILTGYAYDKIAEGKIESSRVAGDGSTILKAYFKQQFTVTYKPGEYGTFEEQVINALDYGAEVPNYTGSLDGSEGYIFDSWTPEKEEGVTVTGNLEYTAQWKKMALPTITHSPTTWTNQDITVTIAKPEGYENHDIEYSVANQDNWQGYTDPFEVEENCVVYARLKEGINKGDIAEYTIDNIDKTAPEFSETNINTELTDQATITIKATDNLSGIVEYGIKGTNNAEATVYKCTNTNETEISFNEIYKNGIYEVYLKDAAGNKKTGTVQIIHIQQYNVAKIVSVPAGYEHLIGTEYETLESAISTSDEAAQTGNVKIEIIHNIHNESNTVQNGRNYTINLNGYKVNNNEEQETLTVEGKLKIVDEKNSITEIGTISNSCGTAINIALTGELTLGEDEGKTTPNIYSPVVEGRNYGIVKEINYNAEKVYDENKEKYYYPEGIFNFYDGKIIGGTEAMILQKVDDTPQLYNPTVITNAETGNQESTLAMVSGIEALIGKKRYMLLEDAISDANNVIGDKNTQVEITIVRDLSKDASHKVVIDNTKNIKLDLNGHVFTTTANDYVLENYGELEIYDSSKVINEETGEIETEGTGKITSSTASTIYNGISSTSTEEIEYEDIDLSKAVANGDYYFETREEGGLISNNTKIANTARSYIEVDLTGKKGMYEVVVNSTISSRKDYDYGYITVRNNTNSPNYSEQYGRKVYVSGSGEGIENKFYLSGGERYYIHFGYRKNSTSSSYNDCFIIKNMKIGKRETVGKLTMASGIYECTTQGTDSLSGYTAAIQNESILYVNGGEIKTTKDGIAGVYNGNDSEVEINGGKIDTVYRSVYNCGTAKINDGTLYSSDSTCVWSDGQLYILGDNVNISGCEGIHTNDSGYTVINAGNIYGNDEGLYNYGTTTIKGGKVSGYVAICNDSSGNIKVENVTITSSDYGIKNKESGTIQIDNVDMESVDSNGVPTVNYGIENVNSGTITFNDGNIHSNYYACINDRSGTIEMHGGNLKTYDTDYATVKNSGNDSSSAGTFKMTGGTITGPANAVYNLYNGKVIITGGVVESTSAYTAIYNNDPDGQVTIGVKDEEVSAEQPVIKCNESKAISNERGTFNFYDGVLIGKENNVIYGVLNDIPEQTELVKEIKEDGLQYVTLGIPTNGVAKIAETDNPDVSNLDSSYYKLEDGYYYFTTLNSAVEASSIENATTIELIDNPWVYRKITIDEGQDITIKFKDKTIYLHSPLNFENNGNLKFINENAENVNEEERKYGSIIANGGLLIKNNENVEMNIDNISIRYVSGEGSSSNLIKLIDNYGTLNINNSKYYGTSGTNYLYAYGIYNEENAVLNMNNTTISDRINIPITNIANDKIDEEGSTIYAVTINNCTIQDVTNYNCGVSNTGLGTILIENSTMNNNTSNESSGNMIIRNSTISSVENRNTGYMEIDNSAIEGVGNYSSGKILIKGKDTNIGYISNSNVNGTVEILEGTVTGNANYSSNAINNQGILIISGGNISATTKNNMVAIYNSASGAKAIISGDETTITGSRNGINNVGEVTITSGKITGRSYQGIYNTNKLILGDKDGNVEFTPVVKGEINGVYNNGTFNFYDGIIEGNETASITGKTPEETEDDCSQVIYKGEYTFDDKTENGYSVVAGREISVLNQINVAYVESKDKNYASLEKALADTETQDTIKIISDVSINGTASSLDISEEKNITLDLNGFNIVAGNDKTIVNNGTLRIIDSTSHEDESGNVVEGRVVSSVNILENNGTATIDNGSYELTLSGDSDNYYNMFTNTGKLEINSKGTFNAKGEYSRIIDNTTGETVINNGIFTVTGDGYTTAINNTTGTINFESGTVNVGGSSSSSERYAVVNSGTGIINIKDGTINGPVCNKAEGKINIYEGTISCGNVTMCTIENCSSGKINIYGGMISSSVCYNTINNTRGGTVNISGGTISCSADYNAIENTRNGTVNISGGTISCSGSDHTIENYSSGIINIDGTKLTEENPIKIVQENSSYGICNYSIGTVNIKGHVDIEASSNSSSIGIYNGDIGTIYIGDNNNITNDVKISSSGYGIYNYTESRGSIYYYGCTITAPTAIGGYIDKVPKEYNIVKSINDTNKEVYEIGKTQDIVSVGETTYNTLEEAISNNNSGTITLLKDIVYTTSEKQTIENNKDFVLDLNGHSIKLHNWETFITNYGTLKITDNTETQNGKIYGYVTNAIRNEGNFEMAGGTITINQRNNNKIIYNTEEGTIKVTGGTLYSKARTYDGSYYIIYSNNSNDINVTGGTFSLYGTNNDDNSYSNSYAIYTSDEDTIVNISGGNFKHEYNGVTYMIYMAAKGNANISGNVTSNNSYGVRMTKGGDVNVSENAYLNNGSNSIYANSGEGEVNINGGTTKKIDGNSFTTVNLTGGSVIGTVLYCGTVDVYEGVDFNVSGNALENCTNINIHEGAEVKSTGTAIYNCRNVNMTGGSITGVDCGIYLENNNAIVNITGGTVNATAGPGILISSGTLNLGEDTEEYPSTTVPSITGSTYGVQNSGGTFNFYDGILIGSTYATNETVTKTPEMFKVLYSADGTMAILGIEATFEQIATVNGIYYDDLASAIDAAVKVNETVEICKDIITTSEVNVPEGSTVTIDLAGFSINGYAQEGAIFNNNGTLYIIDSNDEGTNTNVYSSITNHNGIAIINNGTLIIGNDDEIVNTNSPRIIGLSTAIDNQGTLKFLDGQIGTIEEGSIVEGNLDVTLPTGYEVAIEGNNYILQQES